jgi:hypothetical protein
MRYMDYNEFKKELRDYTEWGGLDGLPYIPPLGSNKKSVLPVDNDGNPEPPEAQNDLVNSPAHYTRGSQECIDTIEEAIQDAPDPITGALQYQVLKYILRMWLKGKPLQDLKKSRWYLDRLINKLEDNK